MSKLPAIFDPLAPYIVHKDAGQVIYNIPPSMFNGFDWKTARKFFTEVNWEFQWGLDRSNVTAIVITCKFR